MIISIVILMAVLLDRLLGEPKRFHPLVGFGNMAHFLEKWLNPKPRHQHKIQIFIGTLATLFLLATFIAILLYLLFYIEPDILVLAFISVVILYFCIAYQSLVEHVKRISQALINNDIDAARKAVGMIVSRDTQALTEQEITSAAIESALENTNDAVFAPLFWFAIAGLPGVIVFRIINTLDAMWGYRTERYNYFGRFAAKLDDLLNFIPARLSALTFAIVGDTASALKCWKTQASVWKSPNAGVVMATGSGALNFRLGGAATYHNEIEERPILGAGEKPQAKDIARTLDLIRHSLFLWVLIALLSNAAIYYFLLQTSDA